MRMAFGPWGNLWATQSYGPSHQKARAVVRTKGKGEVELLRMGRWLTE